MRIFLFCLLLITLSSYAIEAQNLPPILKAEKLKRGIYASFDDFLNNDPSVHIEFTLKQRSRVKQYWFGGSDYTVQVTGANGLMTNANKYWGVCDGDSVYVNASNYQKARGYVKLLRLGRFCYTKGITSDYLEGNGAIYSVGAVGGAVGGAVVGALANIPQQAAFIFNINNGKFTMLTEDVLTKILNRDSSLGAEYAAIDKKAKKDPDVMLGYVEKFNQRHTDEIKRERLAKIVVYRRDKKERADTVNFVTSDSLHYSLGVNALEQFEAPKPTLTLCWSGQCTTFAINVEVVNYFQCLYREGEPVQLKQRDVNEGEYYVRQIKYVAEHPER